MVVQGSRVDSNTLLDTQIGLRAHTHVHARARTHKYSRKDAPIRFCHMEAIECEIENRDTNTAVIAALFFPNSLVYYHYNFYF